jgi:Peptide-N-glycosidase F, C terminal/Peptide-N-glycosidase F, N terminal
MVIAISKRPARAARLTWLVASWMAACSEPADSGGARPHNQEDPDASISGGTGAVDARSERSSESGATRETGTADAESSDTETGPDATATPDARGGDLAPGPDSTISAFSKAHVYFTGSDNRRVIDRAVHFPDAALSYKSITLDFALGCPSGACDAWDRRGYLGLVHQPGTSTESITEILRFATPYGVPVRWSRDVSALRPLLTGSVTLRVFIDTWVGPGSPAGNGWLVDAKFSFEGGTPDRRPLAVLPLWNERSFEVGNPSNPVSKAVPSARVMLPAGAAAVELRALITGHGQGNAYNCAEFCGMTHRYTVGNSHYDRLVWRKDCASTPVSGQKGSWQYPRAGWCPGADVVPWVQDVTDAASQGGEVTISYELADYENTCRPKAPTCTGCTLETGCAYDDGNHTMPVVVMSALLVVYAQ